MPFDAEGYRKAARAQGIPDSEIEKDIAEELGTVTPKADFDFPKKGEAEAKGADSWMAPAAIVGLGSAALAAPGIYKSLKEKIKPTQPTVQIDPELESIPKEWQGIWARSQQNAAAKAADAAAKVNPVPQNYTPSVPAVQPNVPVNPAGAFTQPSNYGQTTLNAPSQLGQPNVTAAPIVPTAEVGPVTTNAAPVIPTEEKTSKTSKKKSEVKTFKSTADIPEGFVFRPDVGNLDRSIYNILGPEGRQYAKDVLNEGKMFGEYKGADYNDKVKQIIGAYGEKLKEITPSIDLTTREGRVAVGAPHNPNYATKGFGKAAKVGGVAGTLFAVADLANAKTAEQKANAGANLLGAILPPGTDILEAGAPTLGEKQKKAFENAQKLGSPYRSVPPR